MWRLWPLMAAFLVAFALADVPHDDHDCDSSTPCAMCVHHGLAADVPAAATVDGCPTTICTIPMSAAVVDRFFIANHHERGPPAGRS